MSNIINGVEAHQSNTKVISQTVTTASKSIAKEHPIFPSSTSLSFLEKEFSTPWDPLSESIFLEVPRSTTAPSIST